MLDRKKVIIGAVATVTTAIVVDTTICIVKGRDWLAITRIMKKMVIAIGSGALGGDELVEEGREIIAKISTFVKGKNIKTLSTEDRAKLHLLREELERFYNAHCKA